MTTTQTTTGCKVCAKKSNGMRCKRCHIAHMAALRSEGDRVIASGKCPCCGTALVRNTALAGWWQCGGYASPAFRHAGFENVAACSYQVFGS
jgi:hypothetical protein